MVLLQITNLLVPRAALGLVRHLQRVLVGGGGSLFLAYAAYVRYYVQPRYELAMAKLAKEDLCLKVEWIHYKKTVPAFMPSLSLW